MSRLQLLTLNCQNSYMAPVKSHIIPVTILDILDQSAFVLKLKKSVQIIPSGQEACLQTGGSSHHIDLSADWTTAFREIPQDPTNRN